MASHVDEGLYKSADPRVIYPPQECGSCSSLVTRAYREGWLNQLAPNGQAQEITPSIAKLLLSANLIDTHNLNPEIGKAKAVDHEAAEFLAPRAEISLAPNGPQTATISALALKQGTASSFDSSQFHHALAQAKNDVTGLDTLQLLTRDYKQYAWPGARGTEWHVGLGTVPESFEGWIKRQGQTKFLEGCREFSKEHKLSLLGILTSFETEGKFKREIAIYAPGGADSFKQFAQTADEITKESLDLEPLSQLNTALQGEDLIYVWQQRQTRSTRKQVAPAFQEVASKVAFSS